MAQISYPEFDYNSGALTEPEYERVASRFSDDGLDGNPTQTAAVTAGPGLKVTISANKRGNVRGFNWESGGTAYTHDITSNSSGQTRVDWVCLRLDRSTWEVRTAIKAGTPGSGSPALLRQDSSAGGTVWEIPLATVTVPNGASSVTVTRWEEYVGGRCKPCTSTRRPTHPRLGDLIYETDTGRFLGWDGTAWRTIYEDTGVLNLSPGFDAWEQTIANVGRRVGDQVWLRIGVMRKDSTFGENDADGSKIAVIPAALRSTHNNYFPVRFSGSAAGTARVEVRSNGEVWVDHSDANINPGRSLVLTCTYLRNV